MGSSPTGPSKQIVDLLVGFLLWCIVKSMSIKQPSASKLQTAYKIVFWAGLAAFASGLVQVFILVGVFNNWPNVTWFIIGQLMPAVVFGIAYFTLRKSELWLRLYQATLSALAVTLLVSAIYSSIFSWLPVLFWLQLPEVVLVWSNMIPLIVWLLVITGMLIVLKKQSNATNLTHLLQQILVIAVIFWVIITVAQTAYMVAQQLPENPNLSGHMPSFYGFGIMLLLFLPAFVMEKRRSSKHSLTVSILTGVLGGLILLALSGIIEPLIRFSGTVDAVSSQWGTAAILTITALIILMGYPWAYRRIRALAE